MEVQAAAPLAGENLSREDRLYRRLKGIRSRLKLSVDKAKRAAERGDLDTLRDLETEVEALATSKTWMRKEFEHRLGIKGPYRMRGARLD